MKKYPIIVFFFLCLTVNGFSSTSAANSVYDSFFRCLTRNNIPIYQISRILYAPQNPSFKTVLQSYIRNRRFNVSTTVKPATIITPTEYAHVSAAVKCSAALKIQLKIRSGGHDYDGLSYVSAQHDFVILDTFNFRSINVNPADKTAWVESGALLGELYYRIHEKSNVLAFPAGICPTVGVGGHISGAGYGNLLRKYGVAVDHVVDAKIVDAGGRILDRKSMGEDLFWAIRGGGGASFGVILAYKLNLVPVPETVTVFNVQRTSDQNPIDSVFQYQQIVDKMDKDLFIRVLLQPVTLNKTISVRATFIGMFLGGADRLLSLTNSQFPTLGLKKTDCKEMSWINSVLFWANFDNKTSPNVLLNRTPDSVIFGKRKSDYVKSPISKQDLKKLFDKMAEIGKVGLVFNSYGGTNSEIPESATPFPHRAGNLFKIQYSVGWQDEGKEADDLYIGKIRQLYNFTTPFVSKFPRETYLNYRDVDIGVISDPKKSFEQGEVYGLKYFKNNFDRLVRIKTKVDPGNVFWYEQSIPVARGTQSS